MRVNAPISVTHSHNPGSDGSSRVSPPRGGQAAWGSATGRLARLGIGDGRQGRLGQAASGSATTARAAVRNAPSRQASRSAIETTATMIVEIALIWGVTPNRMPL